MRRLHVTLLVGAIALGMTGPVASADGNDGTFEPELQRRIERAQQYAESRPGVTGIVVRDRHTGAVWRNKHAATHTWGCSVPKLAMVVDLLLRNESGAITLTAKDRVLMHKMLHSSDNDAATTLWERYGGEDFASRFPDYGMTDMHFTDEHPHTWGWIRTTPDDLDRLINYVLHELPAAHREYIVGELRTVHPNQRWGVWGAGHAAAPGNKNGWSDDNDDGSWVVNTLGFTGPGQRYTVSIMSNTQVIENGFETGKRTTTELGRILFHGYLGAAAG